MFGERKISVKIAVFRSKSVQILIFWCQTLCFHKLWLEPRRLIQKLSKSDQNWPSYDNFKFRWSQKVKHNRARLLFWILVKIGPNFNFLIPNDMFSKTMARDTHSDQKLSKSDQNWPSYDQFNVRWAQNFGQNRSFSLKIGPNFNFLTPNDMFA